jgi:hypothetical protein
MPCALRPDAPAWHPKQPARHAAPSPYNHHQVHGYYTSWPAVPGQAVYYDYASAPPAPQYEPFENQMRQVASACSGPRGERGSRYKKKMGKGKGEWGFESKSFGGEGEGEGGEGKCSGERKERRKVKEAWWRGRERKRGSERNGEKVKVEEVKEAEANGGNGGKQGIKLERDGMVGGGGEEEVKEDGMEVEE